MYNVIKMTAEKDFCGECDFLLSRCKATTFSLIRLQNALGKAEGLCDLESIERLNGDAHEAALRHRSARERYSDHRAKAHGAQEPKAA